MGPVEQQLAYQQMIGQRLDAGNRYALGLARLMQEGKVATTQLMQRERELRMREDEFQWSKENVRPLQKLQLQANVDAARENIRHALVMNPLAERKAQIDLTNAEMEWQDAMDVAANSGEYAHAIQQDLDEWTREGRLLGKPLTMPRATVLEGKVPALRRDKGTLMMRQTADNLYRWDTQYQRDALIQESQQLSELREMGDHWSNLGQDDIAGIYYGRADALAETMKNRWGGGGRGPTAMSMNMESIRQMLDEVDADTTLTEPEKEEKRKFIMRWVPGSGKKTTEDVQSGLEARAIFAEYEAVLREEGGSQSPQAIKRRRIAKKKFETDMEKWREKQGPNTVVTPQPTEDPLFSMRVTFAKQAISRNPANTKAIKERFKQLTGEELPE